MDLGEIYKDVFAQDNMKREGKIVLAIMIFSAFAMLIGCAGVCAATNFIVNSTNIDSSYSSGEFVSGSVKMRFVNETDTNFSSNFAGGIGLLDLLKASGYDAGTDYTCNPLSCAKIYIVSGTGETSKNIDAKSNDIYGIKLTGNSIRINSLVMRAEGNSGSSCSSQFSLDLLDDGAIDFYNTQYTNETCSAKNYSCFGQTDTVDATIGTDDYCEEMNLVPAPAYMVGARVTKGSSTGDLTMTMYDRNSGDKLGRCTLPAQTQATQEIGCIIAHPSMENLDAFACIHAKSGTDYTIRTETRSPCGMVGADTTGDFVADYEIFSQPMKYANVNQTLNESVFELFNPDITLADLLQDYIDNTYDDNCPSSGCIIPFKISGQGDVNISAIKLNYDSAGANGININKIYELSWQNPKISSETLNLDIAKMRFVVPEIAGLNNFKLFFDGTTLASQDVNVVLSFAFGIYPQFVLLGLNTEFDVVMNGTIKSVDWDFGDGATASTSAGYITHSYNKSGSYNMAVKVTKSDGTKSSKMFIITVRNAKDSAQELISRYEERLPNITLQINSYPDWIKSELNSKLNVSTMKKALNSSENAFADAKDDADYLAVLKGLAALNIPYSISTSISGNAPLSFYYTKIDTKQIEEISRNGTSDEEKLKSAIASWMDANYNTNAVFNIISAFGDSGKKDILTTIELDISPKSNSAGNSYFIINYPLSAIKFMQDYGAKALTSASYISVPSAFNGNYQFLVNGNVDIENLGMYISPDISAFASILTPAPLPPAPSFPTGLVIGLIIGLLVITFAAYIALQEWYKRKYENYLFKNKDDLYNIISFISNSRKAGLKEDEIDGKLKKSGWRGEQITYATRKLDGKRTGMYEIPIFKVWEQIKLKEELLKRRHINAAPGISAK